MRSYRDSDTVSNVENPREAGTHSTSGWTTDTKLVRGFDRPVNVSDAIVTTLSEAIQQWPELSETPPLYQFVDAEKLNGLFKTKAVDDYRWTPSVEFQFQGCRVTLLHGSSVRVIIERDP
jgi:hypothetical protein